MVINQNMVSNSKVFYVSNYDILRTPNLDEESRELKPRHKMQIIGSSENKICRFCGKSEGEVSFKNTAHAFPQSIGNNVLTTNYECGACNQFFGNTIENEYSNFFGLYHSIMHISGGNGVPECCYKIPCSVRDDRCANHCIRISFKDGRICVSLCENVDKKYINLSSNEITISKSVGKHCPIAVFKAIVKMAITVMPTEELSFFSSTIKWLLEKEHSNIDNKKLLVRFEMIPGFNVVKYPIYYLYRRKRDIWNLPYMLFNLTYGCFSLFIEVPRDNDNYNFSIERIPFPPIPYLTSTKGVWDLSAVEGDRGFCNSITLSFSSMHELFQSNSQIQSGSESGDI